MTWVLCVHWRGQSSRTHLQGQRVTKMVLAQHRTAVPRVQHCPIALTAQTMLTPQPAMLEHSKVAGQAGIAGSELAADIWRPAPSAATAT